MDEIIQITIKIALSEKSIKLVGVEINKYVNVVEIMTTKDIGINTADIYFFTLKAFDNVLYIIIREMETPIDNIIDIMKGAIGLFVYLSDIYDRGRFKSTIPPVYIWYRLMLPFACTAVKIGSVELVINQSINMSFTKIIV